MKTQPPGRKEGLLGGSRQLFSKSLCWQCPGEAAVLDGPCTACHVQESGVHLSGETQ